VLYINANIKFTKKNQLIIAFSADFILLLHEKPRCIFTLLYVTHILSGYYWGRNKQAYFYPIFFIELFLQKRKQQLKKITCFYFQQ